MKQNYFSLPHTLILILLIFPPLNAKTYFKINTKSEKSDFYIKRLHEIKSKTEELYQFHANWKYPVSVHLTPQGKTYTQITRGETAPLKKIYFTPKDRIKNRELYREVIRLLFYDLIFSSERTKIQDSITVPLWLVEGTLYNVLIPRLVTPHYVKESRSMKKNYSLENLIKQERFKSNLADNFLFSLESASLVEFLISIPLGDLRLKNYLLNIQNNPNTANALHKQFKSYFNTPQSLYITWQKNAFSLWLSEKKLKS